MKSNQTLWDNLYTTSPETIRFLDQASTRGRTQVLKRQANPLVVCSLRIIRGLMVNGAGITHEAHRILGSDGRHGWISRIINRPIRINMYEYKTEYERCRIRENQLHQKRLAARFRNKS